jgi:hypothetical protein
MKNIGEDHPELHDYYEYCVGDYAALLGLALLSYFI